MKLRNFRQTDSAVITSWIKDEKTLYQWSLDRFDYFPLESDALTENYEPQIITGNFFPLTAIDGEGNVAGHLIMRYPNPEDKKTVRFGFVIINPELRGKGNGRKLIEIALDYAKNELKVEKVTIGAFANNPAAWHCYESVGFKRTGSTIQKLKLGDWECYELEYDFA